MGSLPDSQQRNQKHRFYSNVPMQIFLEFLQKSECDSILSQWKMTFQASNSKERNFLNLLSDNLLPIEPLCSKGGP